MKTETYKCSACMHPMIVEDPIPDPNYPKEPWRMIRIFYCKPCFDAWRMRNYGPKVDKQREEPKP